MFRRKKKLDKVAWAEAIYNNKIANPENESEEKLSQLTTFMLEQHLRIVIESVQIARSTRNADTRESRVALCYQHYQEMLKLKAFCNSEQLDRIRDAEKEIKSL